MQNSRTETKPGRAGGFTSELAGLNYSLLVQHARLDPGEMTTALGPHLPAHPATVWITILRDPTEMFISQWNYFQLNQKFKMTLGT